MNFNVFKFYFFAKNFQHSPRNFPACHAFAPVSLASHIDHASISAFPRPCFTAPWFMRNRLARKMAAEMREATCAGTQTSKAPTLSGPSVTNHYSVLPLRGRAIL